MKHPDAEVCNGHASRSASSFTLRLAVRSVARLAVECQPCSSGIHRIPRLQVDNPTTAPSLISLPMSWWKSEQIANYSSGGHGAEVVRETDSVCDRYSPPSRRTGFSTARHCLFAGACRRSTALIGIPAPLRYTWVCLRLWLHTCRLFALVFRSLSLGRRCCLR